MNLPDFRREYMLGGLRRRDLLPDPIRQFEKWFNEAVAASLLEPNAMTLATANSRGQPTARMVLLKGIDARGFIFYTNYQSRKASDLMENAQASLLAFWREMERQVCVCGTAAKIGRDESEAYFKSRPAASQLAAWASSQSEAIPNREYLEAKLAEAERKFGKEGAPLPPHWGGFVIAPVTVEFWQGRANRLHDRFRYTRDGAGWRIERLSP